MNCQNCTHYHDQGGNILCDAGIMEVILIGGPKVVVHMPDCKAYNAIPEEHSDHPIEQAIIEAKKRGRPAKA